MMEYIGIIPARYASTRFPGKPLAMIDGKTMIERVYGQASQAFEHCYVATDDRRIEEEVIRFGGRVVMTSTEHQTGTDRIAEALQMIEEELSIQFDVVVNVQGDEPYIEPMQLEQLKGLFNDEAVQIGTLVKAANNSDDLFDPNKIKVSRNAIGNALYFSRSPIPYMRDADEADWISKHEYFLHIGIYAFRADVLKALTKLEKSSLENAENLEQLRWLENGYTIRTTETDFQSPAVDCPEDIDKLLKWIKQ